jgi:hypothetical protein
MDVQWGRAAAQRARRTCACSKGGKQRVRHGVQLSGRSPRGGSNGRRGRAVAGWRRVCGFMPSWSTPLRSHLQTTRHPAFGQGGICPLSVCREPSRPCSRSWVSCVERCGLVLCCQCACAPRAAWRGLCKKGRVVADMNAVKGVCVQTDAASRAEHARGPWWVPLYPQVLPCSALTSFLFLVYFNM